MKKEKIMWAIQHVPTKSWDPGDRNLELYWTEYEAQLNCPNTAFKPIKVKVSITE